MAVLETGRDKGQSRGILTSSFTFFDTGGLDFIRLGEHGFEDITAWPTVSDRRTTSESAAAFERATAAELEPRLPDVEINDGLGL